MHLARAFAPLIILTMTACSYNAPTSVKPAYDVYSNYDDKVPGRWAMTVASSKMTQDVKPSGLNCSAHNFPVDAVSAFRLSTVKTFENLFEEIELVDTPLSGQSLRERGLAGMIRVEVEDLDVDLIVIPGFWTSEMKADAEIAASVVIDGPNGRLLGSSVEGSEDDRGDAGSACDGGAIIVGSAVEGAMKETLERLGERAVNSPRIRRGNF